MNLGNLKPKTGSVKKSKRIGRGPGSGHGKTACRGHKGQHARSGAKFRAWFEGGQMPLQRRLPKRGFTNIFKKSFQIVNLKDLKEIKETAITPELLYDMRLIRKKNVPVKVLGDGELSKSIEIKAHAFAKTALEKIESAGGKAIQI